MSLFSEVLHRVKKIVYEPNQLILGSIYEEKQNAKYGAGIFKLNDKTVRFRVANITPTKIGQFVAFWQKDDNNKNQPFSYDDAPDLLVINTAMNDKWFGQFVFSKAVLMEQNILSSASTKGKMGIRVYPSWNSLDNSTALNTQKWQLAYFIDLSNPDKLPTARILDFYS